MNTVKNICIRIHTLRYSRGIIVIMNREIEFGKTLELVRGIAKEQGNCISKEQVEESFAALELDDDKLELVFDYLKKHGIGIGEPLNPEE